MILLIASCLFAYSLGQLQHDCESMKQWEGTEAVIDSSSNYMERRRLIYDETSQRERTVASIEMGNTRSFYDVLSLHNEKKEYRIDMKTRKCNVTKLTRPFRYRGITPNSRFQFKSVIGDVGVPNGYVNVATFFDVSPLISKPQIRIVTYPGCIPVQELYFKGQSGYQQSSYYNITIGIRDPAVFIPPEECIG